MNDAFEGRRVVVGVAGSIAAYKACDVVSRLRQAGAQVRVVMTPAATEFVGVATLRALSGHNVAVEMFAAYPTEEFEHLSLADFGEAMVIVGATANVLGKVASGICDDLLTTSICAAACKVLFAPAMNWRMWENPITRRNVAILQDAGYSFVGPDCGHLACGEAGAGRLCGPEDILDAIDQALGPADSRLRGKRVLITSGPTREWLDPVRFLSNPSTGKMGVALAQEALARGAQVTLVTGPASARPPWGADVVPVETTQEMHDAVMARCAETDVLIGAAAPADFRPESVAASKIKKTGQGLVLPLVGTPDILRSVADSGTGAVRVGFAAESDDLEANARGKLERKDLDLIVANDVTAAGAGFGSDTNEVTMFRRDGGVMQVARCSKRKVAAAILDEVERLL